MPSHRPGRPALSPSSRLLCRESQRRLPSPRRLDASRTRSAPPSSAVKHGRPPPPQPALHASQLAASSFPCSPFRLPRPAQVCCTPASRSMSNPMLDHHWMSCCLQDC
ncbi:hypothetical protein PVAP13_5KG187107 [Panicum virgatum]|uniref:Uncharacterized protein n=1 Tax=Panicum virgatum TaxID=38727 RepID=A0A8T0SIC4_PANVG|nr:hypothetical protein PVAP13_5KG187107 [Panicum virgatum]